MKTILIVPAAMITMIAAAASMIALASCTDNQRARQFGGTETVDIPEGRIIVNCTWKQERRQQAAAG